MKYSAQDITRMRSLCVDIFWYGNTGASFKVGHDQIVAEHMLVTYMGNESTPDDLAAEVERLRFRRTRTTRRKEEE